MLQDLYQLVDKQLQQVSGSCMFLVTVGLIWHDTSAVYTCMCTVLCSRTVHMFAAVCY